MGKNLDRYFVTDKLSNYSRLEAILATSMCSELGLLSVDCSLLRQFSYTIEIGENILEPLRKENSPTAACESEEIMSESYIYESCLTGGTLQVCYMLSPCARPPRRIELG